ncbi:DsbA family protein [Nitrospinota bacterium]
MTIRVWDTLSVALVFLLALPAAARAAPGEVESIRKEIEALKQGQKTIQRQLDELQRLIRSGRPQPPRNVVLRVKGEPFKGDKNAPLTVIEFSDFQCPFCSRFFRQTLPRIEQEYIKTGKIKLVYRDYPLVRIHKDAFRAAEAAQCAGDQGKYWQMHDRLFANPKSLGEKDLPDHAQTLDLDTAKFKTCLDSGKMKAGIRADIADAVKAGVRGTPTFLIGFTEPGKSTIKTLRRIRGARPFASFKAEIDGLLATKKTK